MDENDSPVPLQDTGDGIIASVELAPLSFSSFKKGNKVEIENTKNDDLILENDLVRYEFDHKGQLHHRTPLPAGSCRVATRAARCGFSAWRGGGKGRIAGTAQGARQWCSGCVRAGDRRRWRAARLVHSRRVSKKSGSSLSKGEGNLTPGMASTTGDGGNDGDDILDLLRTNKPGGSQVTRLA